MTRREARELAFILTFEKSFSHEEIADIADDISRSNELRFAEKGEGESPEGRRAPETEINEGFFSSIPDISDSEPQKKKSAKAGRYSVGIKIYWSSIAVMLIAIAVMFYLIISSWDFNNMRGFMGGRGDPGSQSGGPGGENPGGFDPDYNENDGE